MANEPTIDELKAEIAALRDSHQGVASDLDAMTRLQHLGSLFVGEGDLGPVLAEIVEAAIAISGADMGNIQLLDPVNGDLKIVAHHGFPQWWLDYWEAVVHGQGVCGTALERGERVIVEDVERSPIFIASPALDIQLRAGVRAVQSTPLLSRSGQMLGMFSTHYRTRRRPNERALSCWICLPAKLPTSSLASWRRLSAPARKKHCARAKRSIGRCLAQ
jgi:GAF domain-containing protein